MSGHVDCAAHRDHDPCEAPRGRSLCGSLRHSGRLMARHRDKLQEDAHFRILRLLQENPEMSQRDMARAVGISTGSIHYVISALLEKGLIKLGNFSASPDRRRYAYLLTPDGLAEKARLTRRFLRRKTAEFEALRAEIADVTAELPPDELARFRSEIRGT